MDLGQLVKKIPVVGPVFGSVDFKAPEGSGVIYLTHLEETSDDSRVRTLSKRLKDLREHPEIMDNKQRLIGLDRAIDAFYEGAVNRRFINPDFTPSEESQRALTRWYFKLTPKDYVMYTDIGVINLVNEHRIKSG